MTTDDRQDGVGVNTTARNRIRQVFSYLLEFHRYKTPQPRQVTDHPWFRWIDDLPRHPTVRVGFHPPAWPIGAIDESDYESGILLAVRRPRLTAAPSPSPALEPWIDGDWNSPFASVRAREERSERASDGSQLLLSWQLETKLQTHYVRWHEEWTSWAAAEKPAWDAKRLYDSLYGLHSQLHREGDQLELLLGDAVLVWRVPNGGLCHPLLLQKVELEFDPSVPEFLIRETSAPPEVLLNLLQLAPSITPDALRELRGAFGEAQFSVSVGRSVVFFAREIAQRIDKKGEYVEGIPTEETDWPVIYRRPALLARKRMLGLGRSLERILEDVEARTDFPTPLERIVGIERGPSGEESTERGVIRTEELLLSRETNREQLSVLRRLGAQSSMVVQGPPGTGKTHTISVLLGHLLAHGKSVLVTSHTEKALAVIRHQLPEAIRPLCLSFLGRDSANEKQLEQSVDEIASRLGTDSGRLEREILKLEKQREDLLRRQQELNNDLAVARSSEYEPVVLSGSSYGPSAAAATLREQAAGNWIPGPALTAEDLPFDQNFFWKLYDSNGEIPKHGEKALAKPVPDPTTLAEPEAVRELLEREAELRSRIVSHTAHNLWTREPSRADLETLRRLREQTEAQLRGFEALTPWQNFLVQMSFEGDSATASWQSLCAEIEEAISSERSAQDLLYSRNPAVPDDPNLETRVRNLGEILDHLKSGRGLGRWIRLTHPEWREALSGCSTQGQAPRTTLDFEALVTLGQSRLKRKQIERRWDLQAVGAGMPRVQELPGGLYSAFQSLGPQILQALTWADERWKPLEGNLVEQGMSIAELARLIPAPLTASPLAERARLQLRWLAEQLREREEVVELVGIEIGRAEYLALLEKLASTHEVARPLYDALTRSSVDDYARAFIGLKRLHRLQPIAAWRLRSLDELRRMAPAWADAIADRSGVHGGATVPAGVPNAWLLRRLEDELQRRSRLDEQQIRRELAQVSPQLFDATARLIERKAWKAQRDRGADLNSRQALFNWHALHRKIPKKSSVPGRVEKMRLEATRYLQESRKAVPGWILPLSRLAEMFDPRETRFDVAIIDEASQCDVFGLIVYYLADKVLVVGDHEQVSPSAVGQQLQPVQGLIARHLQGIPGAGLYDGTTSVYDLARGSSGDLLCLLEHFRSVPEIIQFSNQLSYGGRVRPLRASAATEIQPPVIPFRVRSTRPVKDKVNLDEAEAITRLVSGLVRLPEYRDKSFGVISLVGEEQALQIDLELRKVLSEEVYSRHRIVCGNSAQFQGDERDIMLVSMVDTPSDGPLAMRDIPMFRQRFNVAASRARDQLWVVYSLDPSVDLKPGDLRRRLIEHALDPGASLRAFDRAQEKTESEFERAVLKHLTTAGYRVQPQFRVGYYRIDFAVEYRGNRVALECDGDRYHDMDNLAEDLYRQATLERLGWKFVRVRGSHFYRDPDAAMLKVFEELEQFGIRPDPTPPDASRDRTAVRDELLRRITEVLGPAEPAPEPAPTLGEGDRDEATPKERPATGDFAPPSAAGLRGTIQMPDPPAGSRESARGAREQGPPRRRPRLQRASKVSAQLHVDGPERAELPSREPAAWFALAKWAKDRQILEGWQRSLAFTIGRYLANGWDLSPKQLKHALRAFREAVESGYELPESPQARIKLEPPTSPSD